MITAHQGGGPIALGHARDLQAFPVFRRGHGYAHQVGFEHLQGIGDRLGEGLALHLQVQDGHFIYDILQGRGDIFQAGRDQVERVGEAVPPRWFDQQYFLE